MTQPEITIIDTTPAHLREMAEKMHSNISGTAFRLGIQPRVALWRCYKQSIICRTAFIDSKLAAIWGCGGDILGEVGHTWLITTPEVDDYPFRVAFIYRKELEKMQEMFPRLEDFVDETNEKAVRMLQLMKFKVSKNKIPVGDVMLRYAERRREWV